MALPIWARDNSAAGGGKVAKSAAITIGSGAVRFACSLVTALILTRILSVEDYGLVAMVMPFLAFAMVFADAGASNHTLQVKQLDHRELTLTFWISAVTAFAVFIIFICMAPLLSYFYGEQRLTLLTVVLGISVLIAPLLSQHNALAKRAFRQDLYGIAEIVGAVFGITLALILALNGFGYWSLVAIPVGRNISHAMTIWLLTRWVPGKPFIDMEKAKVIFNFGLYMIFARAISELGKNLDKVLIGWKYGTIEVGYYNVAYTIMMIPFFQIMTPVAGAMIPYFSQIKDSVEKLNDGLINVVVALGILIAPIMMWSALVSESLIVFVIDEKWAPSAPIFSFLAISSIGTVMSAVMGWVMVGAGKPEYLAKWTGISLISLIICYVIGLPWGAVGVAAAHTANVSLLFFFLVTYVAKIIPIQVGRLNLVVVKVVMAAAGALAMSYLALSLSKVEADQHLMRLSLSLIVLLLSYPFFFLLFFGKAYSRQVYRFVLRRKDH